MISKNAPARSLEEKLQRARGEGRMQTALDLAKQIARQSPTPENQKLLRDVSLERGEQLLREGKDKEAAVVFGNTLKLGADADVSARIGVRFAQAGDLAAAIALMDRAPDGPARMRFLGHLVDAAIQRGERDRLAPDLHAGFDAVAHAFARYERGQDAEALDTLQAIGLRSPFLEWRVLLRGLSAYSRGDDAKALENWQRLDSERLPWRLVAPFRFRIDAAFRDSQPAETAKRLSEGQLRPGRAEPGAGAPRAIDQDIHKDRRPARQVLALTRSRADRGALRSRSGIRPWCRSWCGPSTPAHRRFGETEGRRTTGSVACCRRWPRILEAKTFYGDCSGAARNRQHLEATCCVMCSLRVRGLDRPSGFRKILGDDTPLARAMIWERRLATC